MKNSDYVIRYLSLGKFIDFLSTNELFLCRIDKFEDKTEGEWFAHLSKAANKYIRDWRLGCNRSLQRVNSIISALPSVSFDGIVNAIQNTLTQAEIDELDVSEDMSQIMDPEYFDTDEERVHYLKEIEESYLEEVLTEDEESESNLKHIEEIEILKKRAYVCSLFSSNMHSIAMWKLYGGTEEGIAIRIKKESLNSIEELNKPILDKLNGHLLLNDVIYVDGNDIEIGQLIDRSLIHNQWFGFRDLLFKHNAYRYEEEFRINLILKEELSNDPFGIKLKVGDINEFIDVVYLNPLISNTHWYKNVVVDILSKYGVHIDKLQHGEIRTDFTK